VFEMRKTLVQRYARAVPNEEAIRTLVQPSPIVEMGAGTGYWAWLARRAGADVVCYDMSPPNNTHISIIQEEPVEVARHQDRTLFLCWPPYDTPMAYEALISYKGSTVIYVGEGYGGCTGDDAFHEKLENEWEEVQEIDIPQWHGLRDHMWVYKKKAERKLDLFDK
jgi:hypothetical protein